MDGESQVVESSGEALEETPRQQALTRLREWIQIGLDPDPETPRKGATNCSLSLIGGSNSRTAAIKPWRL